MIFVVKLRLHERKRLPVIIGFVFDNLQFALVQSVKFSVCKICPADYYIYKPKKTGIIKPVASLFYQQTLAMEGHKYVNVQQILGNSTEGDAINLARKI